MAERELSRPPGMGGLFARAGLSMVPGVSSLPVIGGQRGQDVGDEVLTLKDAEVDRARLASYDRVCGFGVRDTLPCTYPHMLAFPLHLALMTDPSFPFPAIGLVHIHNRIVQHRPIAAHEPISLRVRAEPVKPHPRGRQVSVRTEALVGGELVWEELSTNLRRGPGDESASSARVPSAEGLPTVAGWKLPSDLGRRYASVSRDYNPIHIHPLSARLFGFPGSIAHGMWTKARCLAALEPRLPEAFNVEVAFRRPIVLPASVNFVEGDQQGTSGDPQQIHFGVRGAREDTPHLDGVVVYSSSSK